MLRHLADTRKVELEGLYTRIGWPLYAKFGHAYDAFKLTLQPTEDTEDPFATLDLEDDLKADLVKYVQERSASEASISRLLACALFLSLQRSRLWRMHHRNPRSHISFARSCPVPLPSRSHTHLLEPASSPSH